MRQLHCDLAGNPFSRAPGYTAAMASLAPKRSLSLTWGSATDEQTTKNRAPVVARYLSAVLAEPLVSEWYRNGSVVSIQTSRRVLIKSCSCPTTSCLPTPR